MVVGGRRGGGHSWRFGVLLVAVATVAAGGSTDFRAPPRFDGAGYAVLAEAITSDRGYREVDRPDAPRHAHFPPGYPAALAALWWMTGRSAAWAHGLSLVCTAAATLAFWRWFRSLYAPNVAAALGLALACNWTWGRTGGAIQSEPFFLLLEAVALRAAGRAGRRGGFRPGVSLGAVMAACVLTRHVGVALAAAAGLDLVMRRRWSTLAAAGLTWLVLMLPWVAWLTSVRTHTQAGLMTGDGLAGRVLSQGLFYLQRLPDQLTGPFVEVATVFQRRGAVTATADVWAILASGLLVMGGMRSVRTPRRRLAGLTLLTTLAVLLVWPFTEAGRFLIPLVPCLLVAATEGLATVAARLRVRRPRAVAATALLAVALPYSTYALATRRAEAQRRTHAGFDAACAWLARGATVAGPVMTRHPGEAYWQTGRHALGPSSGTPEAVARDVDRFGVAYLLVDEERYANAPANPLAGFVRAFPGRAREVWARDAGRSAVRVFEVVPASPTGEGDRAAPP